jgi:3-oxoacyl-[acyl-carrier protein] reductase
MKSAKDRLTSMGGVALVTGASRGIGRATAIRLAADFAAIALVARDPSKLETAAEEARAAGAQTLSVAEDLRQSEAARRIVEAVMSRFGRIDALVNIAGAVPPADLFDLTDADWDDGMALKFHGARHLTLRAWDALKASRGAVVFTSGSTALCRSRGWRQWHRSMRRLSRSPKPSPSAASPMECKLTVSCRGLC